MGLRFRKSVKIAPGVRVNFSKKGVGMSVGTKGARYSVHSSGRRTTTVGLPGTGLYYTSSKGGSRKKSTGGAAPSSSLAGRVFFWLFIGWWWYPIRFCCYDLPKFLILMLVRLIKYLVKRIKASREAGDSVQQ